MKFFFRILILALWMIGIAVSSYAGMKKCSRVSAKAKSTYVVSVTEKQSPVNNAAAKTNAAGVCTNAFVLEQLQGEEPLVVPLQGKSKFSPLAAHHIQEYINQPFAPPRLY